MYPYLVLWYVWEETSLLHERCIKEMRRWLWLMQVLQKPSKCPQVYAELCPMATYELVKRRSLLLDSLAEFSTSWFLLSPAMSVDIQRIWTSRRNNEILEDESIPGPGSADCPPIDHGVTEQHSGRQQFEKYLPSYWLTTAHEICREHIHAYLGTPCLHNRLHFGPHGYLLSRPEKWPGSGRSLVFTNTFPPAVASEALKVGETRKKWIQELRVSFTISWESESNISYIAFSPGVQRVQTPHGIRP